MKNLLIALFLFYFIFSPTAHSQNNIAKKIEEKILSNSEFTDVQLLKKDLTSVEDSLNVSRTVQDFLLLKYDNTNAELIIQSKPQNIRMKIPMSGGQELELELTTSQFLTPDFSILNSHGTIVLTPEIIGAHYQGIIKGDMLSICAISIFHDEIMGFISSPSIGNIVIGRLTGTNNRLHIIYNDKNLAGKLPMNCYTEEDQTGYSKYQIQKPAVSTVNCIRLYWEVNFDIYTNKGGMTNTTNYVLGLFNQTGTLYTNDGIPVQLSQLYVWDVVSPYTATTTSGLLNQFKATRTSFAGDLANLLGYSGGGGVAASVHGLCSSNLGYSMCYSGISSSYQTVPVYSWTVTVVTHEQGHLMGSRHTHSCVWNGNNTAIDGCGPAAGYPYEGSCSGAPIPGTGGTIMSYCHLISAGINFSNGFGPQPTAVILNNYTNASCLSACTSGSFCGACSNLQTGSITTGTATLMWDSALNATGYNIRYRVAGTSTWITDTTSVISYSLSGLTDGTSYEWQVQTICSGNTASFSSSAFFITVPLVCNVPGGQQSSSINALSAYITWSPVNAATAYIVRFKATASIIWLSDTTTNLFYTIHGLAPLTDYEWQIQTICAGGGTSAFSGSSLFTTLDAGAPITTTMKPDAECGKDALLSSDPTNNLRITNLGDNQEMNALAWTNSGNQVIQRSSLQFDLSFIPTGSTVQTASLSLFWDPTSSNIGHSTASGPNAGIIQKATQPWNEFLITWVDQPATTPLHAANLPASTSSSQNYLNIDITDMIQDFVNDPQTNYGMIIQEVTENPYRSLLFCSSDHLDPLLHPELQITYLPNVDNCSEHQYGNCYGTDAFVGSTTVSGIDTTNFGFNQELNAIAWTLGGQPSNVRSLIYWDFTEIPSNAIVNDAELTLYWNPTSSNPGHSSQSGPNDGSVIRISNSWNENTVTWNNQPSIDTNVKVIMPPSTSAQQDYTINVTTLVQGMVSNPATNYGMMIKLNTESNFRSLVFCSSDHTDPSRHPKIKVCYTIPTGIPNLISVPDIDIIYIPGNPDVIINFKIAAPPDSKITLFNVEGQLIKSYSGISGNIFQIPLENLNSGVYIIKVSSSGNMITKKLVVVD